MGVETLPGGATVFTGKHINVFRIIHLISAVRIEDRGLRFSKFNATAAAKKELGLSRNTPRSVVLEKLEEKKREIEADARREEEERRANS